MHALVRDERRIEDISNAIDHLITAEVTDIYMAANVKRKYYPLRIGLPLFLVSVSTLLHALT